MPAEASQMRSGGPEGLEGAWAILRGAERYRGTSKSRGEVFLQFFFHRFKGANRGVPEVANVKVPTQN